MQLTQIYDVVFCAVLGITPKHKVKNNPCIQSWYIAGWVQTPTHTQNNSEVLSLLTQARIIYI